MTRKEIRNVNAQDLTEKYTLEKGVKVYFNVKGWTWTAINCCEFLIDSDDDLKKLLKRLISKP